MKRLIAALGILAGGLPISAQEFVAPRSQEREIVETVEDATRPSIDGIVAEVFKNKQPLQLINPLAPKSLGNGKNTVSWSEKEPGKPKGFILFGIAW